jgi:hypothetical protein
LTKEDTSRYIFCFKITLAEQRMSEEKCILPANQEERARLPSPVLINGRNDNIYFSKTPLIVSIIFSHTSFDFLFPWIWRIYDFKPVTPAVS